MSKEFLVGINDEYLLDKNKLSKEELEFLKDPSNKNRSLEEFEDCENDFVYPVSYCPICSMKEFVNNDMLRYLIENHNTTLGKVKQDIKNRFSSYKDFRKFIKR